MILECLEVVLVLEVCLLEVEIIGDVDVVIPLDVKCTVSFVDDLVIWLTAVIIVLIGTFRGAHHSL